MTTLPQEGCLLRIFIAEHDKKGRMPLFEWIVHRANEEGIAGATVLRGIQGYGTHHQIHTAKILQLSINLPVIIELVDTQEKIEAFMPILDEAMEAGLVTQEKVTVRLMRKK